MQDGSVKSARVIVTGWGQGVWYPAWTEKETEASGLDGWVQKLLDGTVEAIFGGAGQEVDDMLAACKKRSPFAGVKDSR